MKFLIFALICSITIYWLLRSKSIWDGKTRFTVLRLATTGLIIESFDPQTLDGVRLVWPDNLEVVSSLPDKQKWLVKNLPQVQAKLGSPLVKNAVDATLGIISTGLDSQLGVWDRWRWWQYRRRVRWQEVQVRLLQTLTDPDGLQFAKPSPVWFAQAGRWFATFALAEEAQAVRVVNTTDVIGWGSQVAQQLENMGIKVVRVDNQAEGVSGCMLRGTMAMGKTLTVKLIKTQWFCRWEEVGESSQDVTLLLGL